MAKVPSKFKSAMEKLIPGATSDQIEDLWNAIGGVSNASSDPRDLTRVTNDIKEDIKDIKDKTKDVRGEISSITDDVFHQKNILDEIKASQIKVNKEVEKRKKLLEEARDIEREIAENKAQLISDDDLKNIKNEIDGINKAVNEGLVKEEDIHDRLKDLSDEYEKQVNFRNKIEVAQIRLLEKKRDLEENTLNTAKATLHLREQEQKLQIEGYTKLDSVSEKWDNRTKAIKKGLKEVKDGIKSIGDGVTKMLGPWGKMSQSAANYAKNIGLSGKGMDRLRKSTIDAVTNRSIGIKYNTSVEELIAQQQGYTNAVGRQITFNANDYENIAATSQFLGKEGTVDYFAKLENFGLSIDDASKRAGKMFATASKSGLSLEKYSKNIRENINIAQKYTFSNGLRGLESMAKKATEIGLNMSQAASFAEKVNTVEGAVKTGAQLQVLGGPFAQMADPIGMLYESLNNMEGLQDRMVQMFGNLGSFNKKTGEVEISAFNKVRIKEAAKSMGLDENNIFEAINSSARRNEIKRQLSGNTNINKDTLELIQNIGKIQNGVAGVDVNGKFVEATKLTNKEIDDLKIQTRSESDDVKDIAQRLRGWDDSVQGFTKQKDATHAQVVETTGIGKGIQSLVNKVGEMHNLLKVLAYTTMAAGVATAIGGGFGAIRGGARMIKGSRNLFTNKLIPAKGTSANGLTKLPKNADYVSDSGKIYKWEGSGLGKGKLVNAETGKRVTSGAKGYKTIARGARLGKINKSIVTSKLGGAMMKGAGVMGIAGMLGELGMDAYTTRNKQRMGKWEDYAGNMAARALSGAALGSLLGPIGMVLGGIGGAVTGTFKARKHQLQRQVSEAGVDLQGNYTRRELKEIRNASKGEGYISEKLLDKMRMQGDSQAIEQIQDLANTVISNGTVKTTVVNAQKKAEGGIIEGASERGDKVPVMSNAGEMVLNDTQQSTLWNAIKTGDFSKIISINPGLYGATDDKKTNVLNPLSVTPKVKVPTPEVKIQTPSVVIGGATTNNGGILTPRVKSIKPETIVSNAGNTQAREIIKAIGKEVKLGVTPSSVVNNETYDTILPVKKEENTEITNITPRPTDDTTIRPAPQAEKPIRFELSGTWNINIGGNINAVSPDGSSKKVDIDVHELKKLIEQTLAQKINQELSRMDSGGRIINEKAFFHQMSDN